MGGGGLPVRTGGCGVRGRGRVGRELQGNVWRRNVLEKVGVLKARGEGGMSQGSECPVESCESVAARKSAGERSFRAKSSA